MRALAALALAGTLAAPSGAAASVSGLSDDNLPLLTAQGSAVLAQTTIRHARIVVSMGTPARDPQLRLWMHKVGELGWSPMLAARLPAGSMPPSVRAYRAWLRGIVKAYPQLDAIEATNEADITGLSPARAVALFRVARTVHPHVLAGGFSDRPGGAAYVRAYRRLLTGRPTWALHFYHAVVHDELGAVRRRLRALHAGRKVWITETASFSALGRSTYSAGAQDRQTARVLSLSRLAQRTYWQGGESCIGCRPSPVATAAPLAAGAVPYVMPSSPVVWDSYLMRSTADGATLRPSLRALLG